MPYNKENYPNTYKHFPRKIREKAIEILNNLIDEYPEKRAIPIALSQAKKRRDNNFQKKKNTYYLSPDGKKRKIKKQNADKANKVFDTKQEALKKSKELTKKGHKVIIQNKDGVFERHAGI